MPAVWRLLLSGGMMLRVYRHPEALVCIGTSVLRRSLLWLWLHTEEIRRSLQGKLVRFAPLQ